CVHAIRSGLLPLYRLYRHEGGGGFITLRVSLKQSRYWPFENDCTWNDPSACCCDCSPDSTLSICENCFTSRRRFASSSLSIFSIRSWNWSVTWSSFLFSRVTTPETGSISLLMR